MEMNRWIIKQAINTYWQIEPNKKNIVLNFDDIFNKIFHQYIFHIQRKQQQQKNNRIQASKTFDMKLAFKING